MRAPALVVLGVLAALAAPARAAGGLAICLDYGCKSSRSVQLQAPDWDAIVAAFGAPGQSAGEERRAIARAIAAFEQVVGPRTGTDADRGGNLEGSGQPGQMDCIDESTNTTTYLQALAARGMLRWHTVVERVKRARWIFDTHWTAVIQERESAERFAVDSWFLDNGRQPYVQPLEQWRRKATLPFNPDAD